MALVQLAKPSKNFRIKLSSRKSMNLERRNTGFQLQTNTSGFLMMIVNKISKKIRPASTVSLLISFNLNVLIRV